MHIGYSSNYSNIIAEKTCKGQMAFEIYKYISKVGLARTRSCQLVRYYDM